MPKGIVGGAGSYSFEVNKFHDFFHDLFKFSMSFGLAVTFENFQNVPYFSIFFGLMGY